VKKVTAPLQRHINLTKGMFVHCYHW